MRTKTLEDLQRDNNALLARDLLGREYFSFSHKNFSLTETDATTDIVCDMDINSEYGHIETKRIVGSGDGPVDALYSALFSEQAVDCTSLKSLSVAEFYIFVDDADLRARRRAGQTGADAMVKTCLVIDNKAGALIPFRGERRSIILATLDVIFAALEFFTNSERAMRLLQTMVIDARKRNRVDLVVEYTYIMAELVKNAAYSEVLRGGPNA